MDFDKKRNREFFNNELLFRAVGIVFLIIIVVLVFADFRMYQRKKKLSSQITVYQKQAEEIEKSSKTLKDEIANADNKDYLEKIGYEQFNQARPGETVYIFVKEQESPGPAVVSNTFWGAKTQTWFLNFWQWIKNIF